MESDNPSHSHNTLQRLVTEDAIRQLRTSTGAMHTLGAENGNLKLDWVEGVARLLADDIQLESVEHDAQMLWQRGIRHIIWAGMGGSVITVRVMTELGFCDSDNGNRIAIYPLDSTDPAALNAIIHEIAVAKRLALPSSDQPTSSTWLHTLLNDVMMIGVSMGMTSEEPITHLTWFSSLLEQVELTAAEHILVMTLPDSYLDQFAQQHHAPRWSLQLDGRSGTGGRMSAPATRVFLLPAALYLTRLNNTTGQLRTVLNQAWTHYNLDLATKNPEQHPFVQLAAKLADASQAGACRLLLHLPQGWETLIQWIEQLMEESLGKDQKGIVVFSNQPLNSHAPCYSDSATLHVSVIASDTTTEPPEQAINSYILNVPLLNSQHAIHRLIALTTQFLGWQLCMALYGYLQDITFSGQPAVEDYKARARVLRDQDNPMDALATWTTTSTDGPFVLYAPSNTSIQPSAAATFAATLLRRAAHTAGDSLLSYLDLTFNGNLSHELNHLFAIYPMAIGNKMLGVPIKVRRAPAAYHSTEQSEMDGPPSFISLRILFRYHEPCLLGSYDDAFLLAQAISTWQAMIAQGRICFLLLVNGNSQEATDHLQEFFETVITILRKELAA